MRFAILPIAAALTIASLAAQTGPPQPPPAQTSGPIKVEIRQENGQFRLYRGGKPFFIKGTVHTGMALEKFPFSAISARGGNAVRTSARFLDEAHRNGLAVLVNLPMRMEYAHKFDYNDEEAVQRQFEAVKKIVLENKDHPAVLMWAIGNELSVRYTNKKVWDAVNQVARMIREVDPNHPTMTIVGDTPEIEDIVARCPDLHLLGVNHYKNIEKIPAQIRQHGWTKPYVITEWGPSGDWQVPRTAWKASIEETSTEKAERYLERYRNVMLKDTERCLGSFVFIWHWRHERTHTWYGMHLESGERTEAVNVMEYVWSGKWPANRAPRIAALTIDGKAAIESVKLKPGAQAVAAVQADDPEGDKLTYEWEVMPEVARGGYAGMGEQRSKPMPELIRKAEVGKLTFTAPEKEGAYRVFVFIRDGHGNGAIANIPFFVEP